MRGVAKAQTGEIKTPTRRMRVSTLETTAVDLVCFVWAAGHRGNVATVLTERAPMLNPKTLLAAPRLVGDIPNARRLGCLLDLVRAKPIAKPIHAWLER